MTHKTTVIAERLHQNESEKEVETQVDNLSYHLFRVIAIISLVIVLLFLLILYFRVQPANAGQAAGELLDSLDEIFGPCVPSLRLMTTCQYVLGVASIFLLIIVAILFATRRKSQGIIFGYDQQDMKKVGKDWDQADIKLVVTIYDDKQIVSFIPVILFCFLLFSYSVSFAGQQPSDCECPLYGTLYFQKDGRLQIEYEGQDAEIVSAKDAEDILKFSTVNRKTVQVLKRATKLREKECVIYSFMTESGRQLPIIISCDF